MLPDLTTIELAFNAKLGKWEGRLTVPSADGVGPPEAFRTCHAIDPMHACTILLRQYGLRLAKKREPMSRAKMAKDLTTGRIFFVGTPTEFTPPDAVGPTFALSAARNGSTPVFECWKNSSVTSE